MKRRHRVGGRGGVVAERLGHEPLLGAVPQDTRVVVAEHARAVLEHERPAALHEQVVIRGREVLPVGQDLSHVRQAQRGELEGPLVASAQRGVHELADRGVIVVGTRAEDRVPVLGSEVPAEDGAQRPG